MAFSKKKSKNNITTNSIDWENIFAMGCLVVISYMAINKSGDLPPVVNTIAGGFIGYLTRARQQVQTFAYPHNITR